jgi:hypothetical protein
MISYPRIQIYGLSGQICIYLNHLAGSLRCSICYRCNTLLGMANDNPKILIEGAKYIMRNRETWVEEVKAKSVQVDSK